VQLQVVKTELRGILVIVSYKVIMEMWSWNCVI